MTTAQISERDQIALRCRKLRIAESMADRAMTTKGETNQEYLIRLFDSEIESRRNARAAREMRHAGFPYPQSFDDFDSSEVIVNDNNNCRKAYYYAIGADAGSSFIKLKEHKDWSSVLGEESGS